MKSSKLDAPYGPALLRQDVVARRSRTYGYARSSRLALTQNSPAKWKDYSLAGPKEASFVL